MVKGTFQLEHSTEELEAEFVVFPKRSYNKNFIMLQQQAALAMSRTDFPTCALRMYLFILAHVDRHGYMNPVSQRELAKLVDYTHSTVWRGLDWLRREGWLIEESLSSEVKGGASVLMWKISPEHAKRK